LRPINQQFFLKLWVLPCLVDFSFIGLSSHTFILQSLMQKNSLPWRWVRRVLGGCSGFSGYAFCVVASACLMCLSVVSNSLSFSCFVL
jgi:hypothetical protein